MVRYGAAGFWVQFVFLVIAVLLGIYTLSIGSTNGAGLDNILSFMVLALPAFTTFWCRRYAVIGRDWQRGSAPTPPALRRTLWIGIWVAVVGMIASLVSLFGAASAMLVSLLANPQVGLQLSPALGEATPYTVSAIDAVSIMSLLLTLTAEILVIALSLRLVFLLAKATMGK
jgi:hypothetical protein